MQQAKDISIDRFLPEPLAGAEIAADQGRINSRVKRGGVERDQGALRVTGHPNLQGWNSLGGLAFREPVHRGQDLLYFVPDDVASQLESLAINPFAMRLI